MKKLTGESMNITEENLKAMQQLFPEAFEEGKIDFDVLRQLLGDFVDDEQERYSFKWNGKGRALRLSQTPSMGTLRPCKEESKDWDNTENLYIEGDNLEVLKLLQKSYYGKVKMIYIDPPYNTGGDFVYKDNFHDNIQNYKEVTGQVDGEGNKIDTNTESNGRFHTDWLNMMYPRLRLARNLLTDDGVIFISIDDNEQKNLKQICDEVFGESNFIVDAIWISGRTAASYFTNSHEYIVGYAKNIRCLPLFKYHGKDAIISDRTIKKPGPKNPVSDIEFPAGLDFECEDKVFPKQFGDNEPVEITNGVMECKDGKLKSPITVRAAWAMKDMITTWLNGETVIDQKGQVVRRFFFKKNGVLQYEKEKGTIHPNSVIQGITTKQGTSSIENLMGKPLFSFPKAPDLVEYLAKMVMPKDIVLDFFSGSATTAHAIMQMNAEDGGHREFIMVQLPEPTDEKSEAYKEGYKNICEIGKERIRRAGDKIKAEAGDKAADLDIGFKVFKLDSSNLQKWNPQPDDLVMTLQQATDNFLPDRTEQDVLYEIMLKMGLDLTCQIEEEQAAGETVYIIGGGALMICLGRNITTAVAEAVVKLHEEYESELWQVVFRDTGFASDMDKTNVKETLKAAGLDEDSFVCV